MKSDSLVKITASFLSLSMLASTCFTTVTEAAGGKAGIISENPVSISSHMLQSMTSSTVDMVVSNTVDDVASETDNSAQKVAELNKETTEQKKEKDTKNTEKNNAKIAEKVENTKVNNKNAEVKVEKKVSKYANKGIAIADVVNIRKKPNTTSKIAGRLYKGGLCSIISNKNGWVGIKSGNVKGYIRKDLLAIGADAEKIAGKYAKKYAVVNTVTLKVREKNNTNSAVLTLIGQEESYRILKEGNQWCRIKVDSETVGYVLKDYIIVKEKFERAISMEEIIAQQEEEEAEREEARNASRTAKKTKKKSSTVRKSSSSKRNSSSKKTYSNPGSKTGSSVASYALQFKGNPYRYGGTSLTNGTDCSGFVKSVYAKFGYSLARTSSAQSRSAGSPVSVSSVRPGDLLFYGSSGNVNHVGIYIGGGKIVHASNRRDGIKVSNYKYRTPIKARRVIN